MVTGLSTRDIHRWPRAIAILGLAFVVVGSTPLIFTGHVRADAAEASESGSSPAPENGSLAHDDFTCGICQLANSPVGGTPDLPSSFLPGTAPVRHSSLVIEPKLMLLPDLRARAPPLAPPFL